MKDEEAGDKTAIKMTETSTSFRTRLLGFILHPSSFILTSRVGRLLAVRLKMYGRAASEDFLPLTLAPVLIGGALYAFSDMGGRVYAKLLARLSADLLAAHLWYGIFLLAALAVPAALPSLMREVFAYSADDRYARTLPIRRYERFLVVLVLRFLRNLIPGLIVGYAVYRLRVDFFHAGPGQIARAALLPASLAAVLFAAVLSALEIIFVLVWARQGWLSWAKGAPVAALGLALSYLLHRQGWDGGDPLLYPFVFMPGLIVPGGSLAESALIGAGIAAGLACAAALCFKAWSEVFLPAEGGKRPRDFRLLRAILHRIPRRGLDPHRAALLQRDLILTLRMFHRGILLNLAVAFCLLVAMVYAIIRYEIHAGPYLFVLGTGTAALGAFSLSLIAAWLLQYEMKFLWIDQCSHLSADSLWWSKVLLANVVSLLLMPALTAGAVAVFARPPWAELGLIFMVSVLITILVASFTSSLIYEFEGHPRLALFFCFMASVPLAIFVVATYWWLVFLVFPFAMHHLKGRGISRIRIILKHG